MSGLIHEVFSDQVAATPDAVAVVDDNGATLTYKELDQRANRLAHRLVALGVGPGSPVAVRLPRSSGVVVAFLATLKAGGGYLPLHEGYPLDRQQWIVDQSGAEVLITDAATRAAGVPETARTVDVNTDDGDLPASAPVTGVTETDLAYVMYTSGSTGEPKGVAVRHAGTVTLATDPCWKPENHAVVPMLAPIAFDVSVYEVLVPLLHGGRVVALPGGEVDIATLRRVIDEHAVTALHLTAGWFRVVAEESPEIFASVRELLTGGDVIAPTAVARVLAACPDLVVRSLYGTTEATVFSTSAELTAPYQAGTTVSSGLPMDGVELLVLDERLDPVPPGTVGELYLAGRGLARGYLNRTDLTADLFVANPYGPPGGRMYRTGDLARRTVDGDLEFAGRAKDLVKILGFRVEPAEIEAVVAAAPGVADVAVVAREAGPGDTRLAAYVVGGESGVDPEAVREHVRGSLPEYMVPAAFVVIGTLPLTANGKVDRAALPEPQFRTETTYRAPSTPVEEVLCTLFAQVLRVDQVGATDNFFDMGGHSLLGMRLLNRARSEFGIEIPIRKLFDTPTVEGLATYIADAQAD